MSDDTLFGIKQTSYKDWTAQEPSSTTNIEEGLLILRQKIVKESEHLHPDIQKMHLNTYDELFPGIKDFKKEGE